MSGARRTIPTLLTIVALGASAARAQAPVSRAAVWPVLMGVMGNLHDECGGKAAPDVRRCLPDFMRKSGASAQALAFVKRLKGEGFLRDYEDWGPVGAA